MADPYDILGVSREAKIDEIRTAYRALAKKNHPDLHPGDKAAEARFKDISSAYAIIGDETKRALFDSGKIDNSGAKTYQEPERDSYRHHAEAGPGYKYDRQWGGSAGGLDEDLFAELFGRRGNTDSRGVNINYTLAVTFIEAINGAKKRVVMGDGKSLEITIPAGLKDGQVLRLRGQGQPGLGKGEFGDALVEIHIEPHPVFRREGNDIASIVRVTLGEAIGGAKIPVETVSGTVSVAVPKGSNTGTKLRLRGKGVPVSEGAGDHLVTLEIVLPAEVDDELIKSVVAWETKHPYDPRKNSGVRS